MALIVDVISYQGLPYAGELRARFDEGGGSIGRSPENRLVLPDPEKFVSRRHGDIRYENGGFVYTDVSSGGTFLCNQNRRLAGESAVLAEGDRLKIGEYELKVRIEAEAQVFPELFSTPPDSGATFKLGDDDPFGIRVAPLFGEAEPPPLLEPEPLASRLPETPSFIDQADVSPFHESFTPPELEAVSKRPIPEDFSFDDFLRDDHGPAHAAPEQKETFEFPEDLFGELGLEQEPAPPVSPATMLQPPAESQPQAPLPIADEVLQPSSTISIPKPGRPSAPAALPPIADVSPPVQAPAAAVEAELFQCFLEGAGLADFPKLTAEEQKRAMKNLGLVFRDMVSSMIDALRVRAEAKREVRVDMTLIGKANNNPLKFSVTVEDAMKIMIADKYPGFMHPVEAVREGFGDIMNHQLAMTAGIQASIGALLKRFDPKTFEQPYAEGFVFRKESKCWEAYSKAYPNLVRKSMDDLFGDQFVDVYEEQMRILRGSRGKS